MSSRRCSRRLTRIAVWASLCLLVLVANLGLAQTQGRITGRVTDASGAVIVSAQVTIQNVGKGVKRVLETNSTGDYVAPNLEPGFYTMSVEAPNFKKAVRDRVQIEVGKDLKIDFQLTPGATSEIVDVKDEAPLVDATTTTLQGVLSNKAINELPLQGRDFQNLLALHPGVQRDPGGGFHSVTSNGLRPDDNNFVIDGATDNDAYWGETVVNDAGISGTPASNLPLDAIQEFNTQEDPQADFGEKPGVIVNIGIKSGTDQLHGTAYYFHRNAATDARNYFNPSPQPVADLLLHQFGGSIGGPILKQKWFYFANYEGVRSKVGNPYNAYTPVTVHLPEGFDFDDPWRMSIPDALTDLGCDTDPSNCSQLSLGLLQYFPDNPGFTADPNDPTIINFNFNNVNRADNLVFKSDYHLSEHHVLTGRFIYANTTEVEEDAVPVRKEWLSTASPVTQVFGVDWVWTPNSRWINTTRFSFNRFNESITSVDGNVNPTQYGLQTGITDPRLFGFPRINASTSYFDYLGGNSSWPTATSPSHTENYSDTVAYTVGKHALRFGGDFSHGGVDYYRAGNGRGRIDFHYLEDFLQGNVRAWRLLYGDPSRNLAQNSFGLFVQDDFRATQRLTLNLGLRYDVTRPITDSHNRLANYVPSQGIVQVGYGISEPYQTNLKNFSPRLGVAWDVFGKGKTILRSGFGMIYVQPSIRTFAFSGGGLNLNPSALIPGGKGTMNAFLVSPGTNNLTDLIDWSPDPESGAIFPIHDSTLSSCDASSPCDFFAVDQHLKTPYVLNWNLNVQQEIMRDTMLQVAYVANHGVRLYSTIDLNQVDTSIDDGSEQLGRPMTASCPEPVGLGIGNAPCYPYISFLNYLGNKSTSTYHSLQTTLTHRYSNGLYLLAGYTYGHAIDTAGNTNNLGYVPQNSLDYAAEKASGDYDIRHRFTLSATYDLPSRKGWGQMLEGWQVTSIVQWQTGYPILLYDNSNDLTGTNEGPGNGNNDRWNIQGNPNNLRWSAKAPIPYYEVEYDDDGNVISRPDVCTSVAPPGPLQDALDYVGGCYAQNGVIIYPNAFYTFGNMGRNILRGPGFVNWDASVSKVWRLTERLKLQLRGEMFNVANHANFASGSVGGDLTSPDSFGRANATPDVQVANPVIGSGGSRHIQVGVKIIW
ncbi:MAG TPA: TonB-dependent receptor [Terriglobales bacterium]|nr:TonB-dependent receptor [Terriglobales bacterium]